MGFGMNMGSSPSGLLGDTGRTGNKIPSGYKAGRLQQFTPEQMQLFQQLFQHVTPNSYLSKLAGGDQSQFDQMEDPALRQFNSLLGNIGSRFSGMGMGARKSSGFQNTVTSAASNFAQDLQSRRQELQRQAIQDLMGLSGNLLQQRPYENFLTKKPDFLSAIGAGIGGAIPGAIGGYLSGGSFGGQNQGARGASGASFGQAF